MTCFRAPGLRSILLLAAVMGLLLQPTWAQTVLLSGYEGTGSYEFGQELTRIWKRFGHSEKQLLVHPVNDAEERLKRLRGRQAQLAVIDARTAHRSLGKDLRLRVLAVLWPNWLHIVVNRFSLASPSLELARTLLVHPNAMQAAMVWKSRVPEGRLVWLGPRHQSIETEGLAEDAMLLVAPAPVEELHSLLGLFKSLNLASLDGAMLKGIRRQAPWWHKWTLNKNTYPGQNKPLTGLASFSVLVSRVDFPDNEAKLLLELIYRQKTRLNSHMLFRNLNVGHNALFRETFHFHPRSRIFFKFE